MNSAVYRTLWHFKCFVTQPDFYRLLAEKTRAGLLGEEEIARLQLRKVQRLVDYAFDHSKFYRERYQEAGFKPHDLHTLQDFVRLPIVTKDDIRNRIEDFVGKDVDRSTLRRVYSGGSTGVPTMVYHPASNELSGLVQTYDHRAWIGARWGDKIAHVWGLNRTNLEYDIARHSRLNRFLKNTVMLDAFNITPENVEKFLDILNAVRPKIINGYTSALVLIASYMIEHGISLPSVTAVVSTAEALGVNQRKTLTEGFGAPVFDMYGSTEINWIASECIEHNGLHIFEDSRLVETREIQGLREGGELIVTDLENFACPLIRYANQDTGSLCRDTCGCGRHFMKIDRVRGRVSDLFTLPDGTRIHGEYFTHVFYEFIEMIKQFQLHQVNPGFVRVKVIASNPAVLAQRKSEFEERVLSRFRLATRDLVHYEFDYVDSIAAEASGKHRFTTSSVTP